MLQRFPGWGWALLSGVVTLILGILIWREWPEISLWIIGLYVGIHLVFIGWSWVMLALAIAASRRRQLDLGVIPAPLDE